MTNCEAISVLEQVKQIIVRDDSWSNSAEKAVCEAVKMATIALETQEVTNFDTISRPTEPQIQCNKCNYYQGVHGVQGHAPCSYWKTGGVLWNWFCSQAEPYRP